MNEPIQHTTVEQIKKTIISHGLFETEPYLTAPLVLMVSGGSDSVALARLMVRLYPTSLKIITILHVNHLLRGNAADADEEFVRKLADELNIRSVIKRVDVAALAAKGDRHALAAIGDKHAPIAKDDKNTPSENPSLSSNIEQVGREERYRLARELLDLLCDEEKVARIKGRIVTAHTLDDRAETFLMRSTVGTGVAGLRSIPYKNERVVRPLLDSTRTDLQEWLKAEGATWCEDETNSDTTYLRSFIRCEILARMKERNPAVLSALQRTMDILVDEDDYLDEQAQLLEKRFITQDNDEGASALIMSAELLNEPKPLARRVVRAACVQALPPEQRITFDHIEAIVNEGAKPGFALTLPGNVIVRNEYGSLRFTKGGQAKRGQAQTKDNQVQKVEGRRDITKENQRDKRSTDYSASEDILKYATIHAKDLDTDPVTFVKAHATPMMIFTDADALPPVNNLILSSVHNGDRFCPLGMGGHHKLVSDVFIDRKTPARLRETIKVLRAGDSIIWLIGIQQDDRYKVSEKTTTIVRITYSNDVLKGYQ